MKILVVSLFLSFMILNFAKGQDAYPKFPNLPAKTLTRQEINFPADLKAEANILILVFEQQAQRVVDTWAGMILKELEPRENISYYEVPMISSWYSLASNWIDNGMRSGIPTQYHSNTATFYGDRGPYFKQLNMKNKSSCYLFVLDNEGNIRFQVEGPRTPQKESKFRASLNTLLNS